MNAVRDICAVLSGWRQAANVMQSDHPEFWSASAFLPVMMTLKVGMERSHYKVLSAADPKVKINMARESLHPIAQRVLAKLKEQVDTNWHHVEACQGLLELCTACDPRWRLHFWGHEDQEQHEALQPERESIKGRLIEHTLKFHAAKAKAQAKVKAEAARGPTPKKARVLKQQDSFEEFTNRMARTTSPSATVAAPPVTSIRDDVVKQWDEFFDGACIPLLEDPCVVCC